MRKHIAVKMISAILAILICSGAFAACGQKPEENIIPETYTTSENKPEESIIPQTEGSSVTIDTGTTENPTGLPLYVPSDDAARTLRVEKSYTDIGLRDASLARTAATDGMVLLKSEGGSLPYKKDAKVAVIGQAQIDLIKGGAGSGDVNTLYTVNLLQGLQNKEKDGKLSLYAPLVDAYTNKKPVDLSLSALKTIAQECDNLIYIISRESGEGGNRPRSDYNLSPTELQQLENICAAGFRSITVILNIPAVIATNWISDYPAIQSVLCAWYPGMEGGNAIADILCGDVNPSGKLADTFVADYNDLSSAQYYDKSNDFSDYTEDIFVGYRYYETFDPEYKTVDFCFGFGLSYTSFEINDVTVECDGTDVRINATVKNIGSVAGREVVQVYFSAPQGKLGKAARELAAYKKTGLIVPGADEKVTMSFEVADMAGYDDTGKLAKAAYILEQGDYNIYVGNSVRDAGENGIRYAYTVDKDMIVEQLSSKLTPKNLKNRLTADGSFEALDLTPKSVTVNDKVTVIRASELTVPAEDYTIHSSSTGDVSGITLKKGATVTVFVNAATAGEYKVGVVLGYSGSLCEEALLFEHGTVFEKPSVAAGDSLYSLQTVEVSVNLDEGLNIIKLTNHKLENNLITHIIIAAPGSLLTDADITFEVPEKPSAKTVNNFTEVYKNPELMEEFVNGLTVDELIHLLYGHASNIAGGQGTFGAMSKLGIPGADTNDGPAGLRLLTKQTAYPIETLLACTFDDNLLYSIGLSVGNNAVANGVDIWLAPGLNIHRNPLCGRNFEYYSEDPYLTGCMATAVTLGVQSKNVGVMIKHFACNSTETNRKYNDSRISERALREIYLKAFEMTVKNAQPYTVMSSYNKINGCYTSESYELLTDILRGEWGFSGLVSSDWNNKAEHYKEVNAGNDVVMPTGAGNPELVRAAYDAGFVSLGALRTSATRVLGIVLRSNEMTDMMNPTTTRIPESGKVRIKAIDYARKSDGIGSEECTDIYGGYIPTKTYVGEWLVYSVDVAKAGNYKLSFRLASPNGSGAFTVSVDGKIVGSYKIAKSTGGWQNWESFENVMTISLSEGKHEIKLGITAEKLNINYFDIIPD